MEALRVRILPVYSALHSTAKIGEIALLRHQVETLEAFRDPAIDVVFNTAMTGDGKSLSAYLPALVDRKHVVAMYPTNELVRDQHNALASYSQRLKVPVPPHDTMYSAKISELMRVQDQAERLEIIRNLIHWNPMLLTNPDMVHLIMTLQYGWGHKRKELVYELGSEYDYLLFDEFHVFDIPQVIAVTNMLGYLLTAYHDKPQERRKFIFLSATPSSMFDHLLKKGGVRYRRITGSYTSHMQDGYRCILQPCELELHEMGRERRTEQWIEEHLQEIHAFFSEHPNSKGAILVNSVATARRLVALLKQRLEEPYGITIGENTGLTNIEERQRSFEKMLLVGTSTVDIGVDFRINLLIFESLNAGTFIQRFGRLGRHAGYDTYRAYALVPRFVLERFAQHYISEQEVERESFTTIVQGVFPTETEFRRYAGRWGVVQAAQVVAELQQQQDENSAFIEALKQRYERFYGKDEDKQRTDAGTVTTVMNKSLKKYYWLKNNMPEVIAELASFRGQSPLSCGVWDTDGHVQSYDLFFLLVNTRFDVIEKEQFVQQVRAQQGNERDFEHQLLYLKIEEYIAERQSLVLRVDKDLMREGQNMHKVLVWKDVTVLEPRATWLNAVNRRLKMQDLVCIVSDISPEHLKAQLHLGALFQVMRLEDNTGSRNYSIIFGQSALLAETELFFRKTENDHAMIL